MRQAHAESGDVIEGRRQCARETHRATRRRALRVVIVALVTVFGGCSAINYRHSHARARYWLNPPSRSRCVAELADAPLYFGEFELWHAATDQSSLVRASAGRALARRGHIEGLDILVSLPANAKSCPAAELKELLNGTDVPNDSAKLSAWWGRVRSRAMYVDSDREWALRLEEDRDR